MTHKTNFQRSRRERNKAKRNLSKDHRHADLHTLSNTTISFNYAICNLSYAGYRCLISINYWSKFTLSFSFYFFHSSCSHRKRISTTNTSNSNKNIIERTQFNSYQIKTKQPKYYLPHCEIFPTTHDKNQNTTQYPR
jgi:hypothetical protein